MKAERHSLRTYGTIFFFTCFTEYYHLFSREQPVPAHLFVCTSTVSISVCVICHLSHRSIPCITSSINQSSLLVICQLHFPACSDAKLLCKPLWEINTINTVRFNCPMAHHIFKYLCTVFLLSCFFLLSASFFFLDPPPSLSLILFTPPGLILCPPLHFLFLCPFLRQLIDISSPPHQSSDGGHNNPSPQLVCL